MPFAGGGGGLLGTVREPFQPFVEAGQQGAASLRNPMNIYFNDPGFRFRLEEGQKALERSAAARGGLVSGQTLQDVQQFGQRLASEEYGNAYNRALAAAGLGLGATSTQAGLTSDVGSRIVQGLLGLGQQESDIAREIADIASFSTLGAGQAIANRERLLGEIKAGKKASQLTTGEQLDEVLGPVLGVAGGLIGAYFGGPAGAVAGSQVGSTLGGADRSEFQGRNMTAAERLIESFGRGGE